MKAVLILLLFGVSVINAGYITPPLQAVLDTLSPDSKTTVCVHLVEKPSLNHFPQKAYAQKIAHLKEFSQRVQRPLIDYVNTFSNQVDSLKSFWVFNGFSFKGTKEVILTVAPIAAVEFVNDNELSRLEKPFSGIAPPSRQIEWNIDTVKANDVWQMGYTGEGIVICIFDSGMREDHESYGDFPNNWKWRNDYGWRYAWFDTLYNSTRPHDPDGHGTHVGGIALGGDGGAAMSGIGIAYDAYTLRNLGIIPVFCIGNTHAGGGWRNWPPGNFPTVISVGATKIDDQWAWFSGHGPAPDSDPWNNHYYWSRSDWDSTKPDLVAPGCSTGTESGNTVGILSATKDGTMTYGKMWGTSQATPHITGAIALMLEASRYVPIYEIKTASAGYPFGGGPQARKDQPIKHFFFHGIYPNPARDFLKIKFNSPDERMVSVKIYDVAGRLVQNLFNRNAKIGMNEIPITANDISSGVYFIKIETKAYNKTERIVFLR